MFLMDRFSKDKNPRFRFVPITVKKLNMDRSLKEVIKIAAILELGRLKMTYGFLLKFSHRLEDIINVQIGLTLNGQFFFFFLKLPID